MTLMVSEVFPRAKPKAGDVGIEIEVEGIKENVPALTPALTELWATKPDLTLRGGFGMEFVSREALYLNNAFDKRIGAICDHIHMVPIVEDSPNTSIHIHHNRTHKTLMGCLNGAAAWWLLENLLVSYCGPEREGNMFCLRLCDAEAIIPRLTTSCERFRLFYDLNDTYRYAALNLKALNEFGSIEIRSMRGVVATAPICEWARETFKIFNRADEFKSPEDVFDFFIGSTKAQFVRHFVSAEFADKLMNRPNWQGMMDDSAVLVCNFAYALDWGPWEKRYIEHVKKEGTKRRKKLNVDSIYGTVNLSESIYEEDPYWGN